MAARRDAETIANSAFSVKPNWLGNSVYEAPRLQIQKIKSWPSITAMSYHRGCGEAIWRGDRHRLILARDPRPPMLLQVEQGRPWETTLAAPGTLSFCPAGLTIRAVQSAARHVQVVWDTDLYSTLLPELGAAASRFELYVSLQDLLLSQLVTTLLDETEGGFADRILVERPPCVSASPSVLSGIFPCRPPRAFRRSGCSACATTSRRISMKIFRSLFSPISPV